MSDFHNPYHFVPVRPGADDSHRTPVEDFDEPFLSHGCHGRYAVDDEHFHGRVVCRLTTQTPVFVGASRTEEPSDQAPGRVAPYELDGQPAIPASSLRGLVSAIAEAASQSAMRVLDDHVLTRRMEVGEALSALGMVKVDYRSGKTRYRLLPLCAPVMHTPRQPIGENKGQPNYNDLASDAEFHLPEGFQGMFDATAVPLKICMNGDTDSDGKPLKTYSVTDKQIYYMNTTLSTSETPASTGYKWRRVSRQDPNGSGRRERQGRHLLLYQQGSNAEVRREQDLNEEERSTWRRGIVRHFSAKVGRKRHQYFIPYPEDIDKVGDERLIEIPPHVARGFHCLADQRTSGDDTLPNIPTGTKPNAGDDPKDKRRRLKTGDIVFFDADDQGRVSKVAFSAIWREVSGGSVHDYFGAIDDGKGRDILPFGAARGADPEQKGAEGTARSSISPTEMVFGFVEMRGGQSRQEQEHALAYSGRARFSAAQWTPDPGQPALTPYLPAVTLKILDSPKPPSPAMYFTPKNPPTDPKDSRNCYIAKDNLNPDEHRPQGRKVYLHHFNSQGIQDREWQKKPPWRTAYDESADYSGDNEDKKRKKQRFRQKVKITPLADGLTFWFHVDFDNLNRYELGMLCYALQPAPEFLHKIGMGKPLGLGSVKIEPAAIFYIDRKSRYGPGAFAKGPRYHGRGETEDTRVVEAAKQGPYDGEFDISADGCGLSPEYLRDKFRDTAIESDNAVIEALELLGNPDGLKVPVRYPNVGKVNGTTLSDVDKELERYRWWVVNDKAKKESMTPVDFDPNKPVIPTLKEYDFTK